MSPSGTPQPTIDRRTEALLRRLVRREADAPLRKLLAKTPPQDIAAAMEHLTWSEQRRMYRLIEDADTAAEVLAHLSGTSTRELTREMSEEAVADLLERMEPDDATDIVGVLPHEFRDRVLVHLEEDESGEEVKALLAYDAETAGGIMSTKAFVLPDTMTCGEAIASMQAQHDELETAYYLYVVDANRRLVGVASLRSLLTYPPRTPLTQVMTKDVISVPPEEDQEEVARVVARYDLLAVPVVDEHNHILGIVTVDDVVDVFRAEAAEDMMLMAGVSETAPSLFRRAAYRAGWLTATIAGGIVASELIGLFESTLAARAILAGFVPVIMGMGGNVGIQSATLAVRGLATGRITIGGRTAFIWREARVGLALGCLFATMLTLYGFVRYPGEPLLGPAVGLSIFLAIAAAGVIGATMPLGFQRVGVDPAVSTTFVTMVQDLLGIIVYFTVARALLF